MSKNKSTSDWMDRLVEKYAIPTERVEKPTKILTEEQIKKFKSNTEATSLVSIHEFPETPANF